MNFSPFGGHFPTAIPTIHQFAAKFSHDGNAGGMPPQGISDGVSNGPRYHTSPGPAHFNQHHPPIGMPVNMGKYVRADNLSSGNGQLPNMMNPNTAKYTQGGSITSHHYENVGVAYNQASSVQQQPPPQQQQQPPPPPPPSQQQNRPTSSPHQEQHTRQAVEKPLSYHNTDMQPQDLCSGIIDKTKEIKRENSKDDDRPNSSEAEYSNSMVIHQHHHHSSQTTSMPASWQSLATPGSTVADYLSHLPASTLPLSLHHFLKYSAENIKKESDGHSNGPSIGAPSSAPSMMGQGHLPIGAKKKKKKKINKEKKPRPKPGEIRLTTALDGSTLYCCPECHMAYPEKDLLEQHLLGHTLERRFVCDICGAGLKRKDHLTRHKQSHNPERPYVCTVCLKAFKRKEQLTLHFVIHSGEKRHVCTECGKGFYRKDHLRKHTRSHIARRVKAELSQHAPQPQHSNSQLQVATVSNETPPLLS